MSLDELRREFQGWKSRQPKIVDDADLNYIGKFVFEKLTRIQNILNEADRGKEIAQIKQKMRDGRDLINFIQGLMNEHSQDFTHEKRKEELKRIEAEKNKLQNEIWDIKASIMNKAVDGVPNSKWASAFTKVGITLITASLTAFGITYAGAISSGNISGITIISISIILAFGICLFGFGANQFKEEEKHRNEIYDRFLSYLELKMRIDDTDESEN